jgi:hypothetical protein
MALGDDATVPRDRASTIARAQSFHAAIRESDSSLFWAEFNETMREAVGPAPRFDRTLAQIVREVGLLERCPSEVAALEGGFWVYSAECRFSKSPVPVSLVLTFDLAGKIGRLWIKAEAVAHPTVHLDYETKAKLELPFHGEWWVFWGGRMPHENSHVVSRDQRFAYDFVVRRGGKRHHGSGRVNSEYYCFGLPIVAPAAGRIVWLSGGVDDNRPGQTNARQPIGNGVVLDHGAGEFSVMAHFQRDSLTVKLGQVVAAGDTLGRCGNSGKSTEPHLHYHLQDGPVPLEGDGLPAFFHRYQADGKLIEKGEPSRGQYVSRQ